MYMLMPALWPNSIPTTPTSTPKSASNSKSSATAASSNSSLPAPTVSPNPRELFPSPISNFQFRLSSFGAFWCKMVYHGAHEDSGKICPSERIAARKNRCTGPQPGQDAQAQLQSHARRADRERHRSRKAQTAGVLRIGRTFSQRQRSGRSQAPRRRAGPHGIWGLMPRISRWADLPPNVRQHLLDRMRDRAITLSDLNQLRLLD